MPTRVPRVGRGGLRGGGDSGRVQPICEEEEDERISHFGRSVTSCNTSAVLTILFIVLSIVLLLYLAINIHFNVSK